MDFFLEVLDTLLAFFSIPIQYKSYLTLSEKRLLERERKKREAIDTDTKRWVGLVRGCKRVELGSSFSNLCINDFHIEWR